MKKILTTLLLAMSLNVIAFGGWNNGPWNSGGYNNNGFIAYNPFSTFSPDWFQEEMNDFVDEFDNNRGWGNRGNYHPRNNRNFNNGPWNNNNFNNMPWGNNPFWNNGYNNR